MKVQDEPKSLIMVLVASRARFVEHTLKGERK